MRKQDSHYTQLTLTKQTRNMRRFLFIITLFFTFFSLSAARKSSKELAKFIRAMVEEQSIHPDSMYVNILKIEAEKDALTDPTEKAVYQAVLGYLYNRYAYTASASIYVSDSDDDSMRSWSYDDYKRMAGKRYAESLSDLETLHGTKISEWTDIVEKGADDKLYDNDMLKLVWTHAQSARYEKDNAIPSWKELKAFYEKHGNRRAVLMLIIDNGMVGMSKDELLKLKDEYKDLDMCAEIYLRLSHQTYDKEQRAKWLREGLKLYPHYKYKARLQEYLQEVLSPSLHLNLLSSVQPYPEKQYRWVLNMQNVQQVRLTYYRLSDDFNNKEYGRVKNSVKYLKKHATLVDDNVYTCSAHPDWESFRDTLVWTSPDLGRYLLVAVPQTSMKLASKVRPAECFFNVSRLTINTIALPNGIERIMVSDAISGKPVEGADIKMMRTDYRLSMEERVFFVGKTDKNGNADVQWKKDKNGYYVTGIEMTVSKDNDTAHPTVGVSYGTAGFQKQKDRNHHLNFYTDRSIYRPGQVVHVGGVDWQHDEWNEEVISGLQHRIVLFDPNGKVVSEQKVKSDSMGVFSADFTLPETGLPGSFRFAIDASQSHYIEVEEYKRPTFEVTTDEAPAIQMPADSITLTGRAVMYSGAPVRGARVAAQFRWNDYWWRWGSYGERSRYDMKLDTVLTDDNGCFKVTVPINQTQSQLRYGKILNVHYDVVSPSGETHTAEHSVLMCSSPLTLQANIPDMIDRDNMSPWSMVLISSTGAEVQGNVQIMLKKDEKVVFETTEKSGNGIIPKGLLSAPSGRYNLNLLAVLNGDTATYKKDVVLFSQHDTKLPVDSTLWFYVADRNMSSAKAARVQIGTSKDVYLRYVLASKTEVVSDRLLHLNDTVMTVEIPYEDRYDKTLTLNVMLVKNERTHKANTELLLVKPDKELNYKWITFRDKLQPGQKETWQLQLTTPDGKPASANLMASLYDASLDAILGHSWSIRHFLNYSSYPNIFAMLTRSGQLSFSCNFELKEYKSKYFDFAKIAPSLFELRDYGYVDGFSSRRRNAKAGLMIGGGAVAGAPMPMAMALRSSEVRAERDMVYSKSVVAEDAVMEESIVSNDAESQNGSGDDSSDDIIVPLRENFNETAFFYPALRTNEKGEVTLSFTLPESLTTWRLLGLAHTQNMLTALLDEEIVAQKDLMAQLSLPRFLRQGDKASLSASIYNISKVEQKGRGVLTVLDAATEKVLFKQSVNFRVGAENDTTMLVPFSVPEDASMLICRWAAEGSTCSDGEQRYLPVLSNKEWITESKVLTYTKAGTYKENVAKMFDVKGATNKQLTIEYVSQPVWYAVQALPSLAWPKNDDALSLATAYYAGSLSACIAAKAPVIADAIESWKEARLNKSKLLQNEELKNIVLQETPWIAEAEAETEKMQRLSTLFDNATQSSLQKEYLDKLRKLQASDGSFSWFPGMKGSYYMTREVAYILARLKVLTGSAPNSMLTNAINYIRQDRPTYLGTSSLRYLYVLYHSGVSMDKADRHNADSLIRVLSKHPEDLDIEQRALAAIVLKKAGKDKASERYLETVKKFLVTNDEGLTYFEFPQGSHRSINRKLHIHVQVMEALAQLSPKDSVLLDGMRRYLLRHKRTSEWDTPVNTANAVYSLLLDNTEVLQQGSDATVSLVEPKRKTPVDDEGTSFGYLRKRVEVTTPVSAVEIKKKGNHESWGGIYAQYLAPITEIAASEKGDLSVKVEVQVPKTSAASDASKTSAVAKASGSSVTSSAPVTLRSGNRVHVRYVITAEKDFEYVYLHAPRPATAEPVSQLSGYRWRNGLGYYRAVKDAAVNFFFDYLPRGSYVIEEDWLVEREGEYSTGITTIQCLYAPEFSGHSSDQRMKVDR